eukprot:symbB.v1.2.038183.t1/scaffold5863.1/size22976/1
MTSLFQQVKDDVSHISKLVKQQQTSLEGTSFDMSAAIQAQAIAVKNRINVLGSLQPAQSAELQELVLSGPWTDIQKGDISSAITAGCVASSTTARGPLSPKHQTMENFMGYLSLADSEKLADPAVNKYMKLEVLSSRAIAIGLFKPDEKSFKSILGAGVQKAIADGAVEPQKALTDGSQEQKQDLTDSNETKNHEQESPLKPRALFDVGLTEPKVGLTEQQAIVEKAMEARSEAKGEKKTTKPGKTTKDVKKEEKTEKKAKSEKTEPNEKSGLKMDRKNCHSRAYHRALKVFEQKGYSHEKAKEKAAAEASKELQKLGFEPSGMAGKMIQKKPASKKK